MLPSAIGLGTGWATDMESQMKALQGQLTNKENKMSNETKSNTFFIAGVKFHPGAVDLISKLEVGEDLELVPEPDNKYDPNAIKIEYGGFLLGYVPKKLSAEISALMEIEETECLVQDLNPNGPTWEMCEVVVRPVVPEEFGDLDLDADSDIDESDLPDFDYDDESDLDLDGDDDE